MQCLPTRREEGKGRGRGGRGGEGEEGGRSGLAFLRPVAAASGSVATDPARLPLFATRAISYAASTTKNRSTENR